MLAICSESLLHLRASESAAAREDKEAERHVIYRYCVDDVYRHLKPVRQDLAADQLIQLRVPERKRGP